MGVVSTTAKNNPSETSELDICLRDFAFASRLENLGGELERSLNTKEAAVPLEPIKDAIGCLDIFPERSLDTLSLIDEFMGHLTRYRAQGVAELLRGLHREFAETVSGEHNKPAGFIVMNTNADTMLDTAAVTLSRLVVEELEEIASLPHDKQQTRFNYYLRAIKQTWFDTQDDAPQKHITDAICSGFSLFMKKQDTGLTLPLQTRFAMVQYMRDTGFDYLYSFSSRAPSRLLIAHHARQLLQTDSKALTPFQCKLLNFMSSREPEPNVSAGFSSLPLMERAV